MSDQSKTSAPTQDLPGWAQAWKGSIGNYEMGDDASQRMTELLGNDTNAARMALYERSDKKEGPITQSESKTARTEFIKHVGERFAALEGQQPFTGQSIKMEALLGEEGVRLYEAACLEENNTREFREAVFLSSTTSLDGPKWSEKLVLWVGGPSASGKSFGTEGLLNTLNDPDNPKGLNKSEKEEDQEKKNHVVAIDGGKEREMSQMRQLVLQIALAKGYSGVKDLEKHSANIKTKGFVQKAVLETDLNMAIPATFTSKPGKQEKLMKKFAETPGVKQIYAQVRGVPSVEEGDKKVNGLEQFRQSVKKMGMKRAFRLALPKDLPSVIADLIKPNNRKIGVESKNYDGSVFDYGMKQSNDMREKFKAICQKNNMPFDQNYYEITNDLLFIKKDSKGEWIECTKEDPFNAPDIVLSTSRAFEAYKLSKNESDLTKKMGPVITQGGHDAREKDQKDPNEEKISTINAAYRALKGEKKSAVAAPAAPATATHAAPPVLGRSASVSAGSLAKEPKLDKAKSSGLFSRLARSASAVVPRKNPASKTVPSGSDSDSLSGSSEIFNSNPLYSLDSSPIQSNSPSLNSSSDSLSTSSSLGSDTESTDKYNGKYTPTSPVSQIPPVLKSNQESSDEIPEVFPPLPDIPGELPDTVSQQLPPLPSIPQGSPMEKLASMLASAPPPPRPLRRDLGETIPGQIRQNTSVADEALNDERKTPINFRAQAPRVSTSLQSSPVQNGQQIVAQNPSFPVPNRPPPLPPINKANSAGQDALAVHSAPVLGAMGPKKERRPRVFGTVEELEQAANQARIQIAATKAIEVQVPENKGSNELSTRKNGLK